MIESTSQKLQTAGGAEREAREIHEAVERGYARWDKESQCGEPSCGCVTAYIELELEAIWDVALEKCANEARLEALANKPQCGDSSDLAAPAHRGVAVTGTQVHAAVNECVGLHGMGPDFPSTWVDSDINFNELAIEINKRLAEPQG